jgi:hypothetical protein
MKPLASRTLARTIREAPDQAARRAAEHAAGRSSAAGEERCDLCAAPTPADHRHLLESGVDEVLCACRPCSLLFVRDAAAEGRYRLVPQRRTRLDPQSAPWPAVTEALGVPVGLAFFVPRADGSARAHYPSPAGATRWEIDKETWARAVDGCPQLASMTADVEALLVNAVQGRAQYWIVPIDDCFRMVAVVRREWRGLTGGSRVWPEIDRFFAGLTEQ